MPSLRGRRGDRGNLMLPTTSRKRDCRVARGLAPRKDGLADFWRGNPSTTWEREDALWPALARHIARRSTEDDRALLGDLARHPERREPPLGWGLQYIVRGDVMLNDGTVLTLDDLAKETGVEAPPFLEPMPERLEIDWEKEE